MPSVASSPRSSAISAVTVDTIHNRFSIVRTIGSGSFGVIFLAKDTTASTTGALEEVAVKLESEKAGHPYLIDEIRFLNLLKGGDGIPRIIWSGREQGYVVMVMDLLGPSLSDLFKLCSKRFSIHTVLMLADQLIARLEYIHSKGIVHRDLKPDNFLMGTGDSADKVHIIDFGLANKYIVPGTNRHIPFRRGKSHVGTLRYGSINAQLGSELSRRDDLESLGYVLIYFLRGGKLPWQGLKSKGMTVKQKFIQVPDRKLGTSLEQLCEGLPEEFVVYMEHCINLKFEQSPDYSFLRQTFRGLAEKLELGYNRNFDWSEMPEEVLQSVRYSVSRTSKVKASVVVHSRVSGDDNSIKAPTF